MITPRPAAERGHFNHGWLRTWHTFSFADYHDPAHMGFRTLRVINEDIVQPGQGFGEHGHRDMEILTWILEGALEHRDSMGNGSVIVPGDAQRMSAGTGLRHSEFNASRSEPVHLLQIWILPEQKGIVPSYEQKHFPEHERLNRLLLLASRGGRQDSVTLHQDTDVFACLLAAGKSVLHTFREGRGGWIQAARGSISVNGTALSAGDGAALEAERTLKIAAAADAEFLLFDMP